ncbi:MAG TPA: YraN family protein [Acidimicrobiales bacterium]|jgi:putative endonuclease|nr:YraN family protein [Acidimicrobiales bacterium]
MADPRRALGAHGEDLVAAWYEARGYDVVDRNWRVREGEIDLVLARGRDIVFCEVKTRSSAAFGPPSLAVTPTKQRRLRKLGSMWLSARGHAPTDIRFDVASVLGDEIEVLPAAF